ncbi:hypothetical protein B0O80DRAFT_531899 [Mortierella sp. GBAus27b]|nr:hypothetical protein BGX31_011593 [Mortierella sp. GBA43]KAI8349374.1 hypothetical protein B0O80DRAFT_531899 [Mortierella sp. GBAus27b]
MTETTYPVGTTVFAKLKGYPWWPARIESEDDLPKNVSSKKPKQRPIWPVFFFGSYDYGWFGTSELKAFDPASAEKAKSSLRKGNALRTALSEALDPSLVPPRTNNEEEGDYDDEDEGHDNDPPARKKGASKPKKSTKTESSDKQRKVSATEDQAIKRKTSKRSVPADVDDDDEPHKNKKRASITPRSHLDSEKRSIDDDIGGVEVGDGRTRKSEEDAGDDGDARAKKKMRGGQPSERLLKLRHKLQKLLLVEGLSDEVLVQNLERADPILAEVEAFEIDLHMLKDTKIGRLMKKISVLQFSQDPRRIVERSIKLINQYKSMMEKAQENGGAISPTEKAADTPASAETKAIIAEQKPIEPEGSLANGTKLSTVSSHAVDVAPAPEAAVAVVTTIVETNTLVPQSTV